MILYSIIMFLTTTLLLAFGIAIYKGKTNLIHSYHQTKVSDKEAYGKAFGKALFVLAAAPLLSGIAGLLGGQGGKTSILAVALLAIGLCIGIGFIVAVQSKYNKGIF